MKMGTSKIATMGVTIAFPDIKIKCQGCGLPVEIKNEVAAKALQRTGRGILCDSCRQGPVDYKKLTYAEYLKTEWWKAVRTAALKRADHKCQLCNGNDRLEVHHNTYARLGKERPSDVLVLCHDCHDGYHKYRELDY